VPLVYLLNEQLKPLQNFYLGDAETAQRKAAAVSDQGKAR
jgi:2,3-bisphosphoglycerate-dependent phosphoglycerate mutase